MRVGRSGLRSSTRQGIRPAALTCVLLCSKLIWLVGSGGFMKRVSRSSSGFIYVLFCSIVLCGLCRISEAQTDLNGYWDLRVPNPSGDGTFLDTYFQLQTDGSAIHGQLIRWRNQLPIAGTLEHGDVHFATQPMASAPRREQKPVVFD